MGTLRFTKSNKIKYGQDHCQWRGVPAGVDFDVQRFGSEMFTLTASGYGLAKRGHYGNGKLYVWGLTPFHRKRFESASR